MAAFAQARAGHELGGIAVHPPAGRGRPGRLPERLRSGVERLSGVAMDDVTVHTDSPEPARYQALAYARGPEIHVAPGQEKHLAHEAWHVVQQKQRRVRPTLRTLGAPINDDHALEAEAHRMGQRAERAGWGAPAGHAAAPAPGWTVQAPAQLLVGQTRFNWGIWARGGGSITDNVHLAAVHDALGRYHPERGTTETRQAFSDRRARALDDAQQGVHRYLGGLGDLQQGGLPRDYMLGLADELQQAQVEHVDFTHQNDLELYSSENLDDQQRQRLTDDWNEVRGGVGTIRLPQGQQHAENNRSTRAAFARLMSKQHGRELVRGLLTPSQTADQQPWQMNVSYTRRLTAEQRAQRLANRREYERLRPAFELARQRGTAQNATQEEFNAYVDQQQLIAPFMGGERPTDNEEPAAASERAHGADLRILTGLRDSEFLNHSGVNQGLIAGPSHIILGHEMVHALHYKQGQRDMTPDYGAQSPHHHWGNAEERQTISTGAGPTENRLRAEHGLPNREGHTSKRRVDLDAEESRRRRRAAAPYVLGATAVGLYGLRRYLNG